MPNFQIKLALTEEEKKQAYQLRYKVFLKELNNNAHLLPKEGIETDIYDKICDHLIIMDKEKNLAIGTYRLLPGRKADPKIGFYAERIFNIEKIKQLGAGILEVGRSCVHKDYREGAAINLLWKGIADYIKQNNINYLFGSVRLYTTDPLEISEIFCSMKEKFYSSQELRVEPLKETAFKGLKHELKPPDHKKIFLKLPALLKGYLRMGIKICGPPAQDRHLESVVLPIAMRVNEATPAYRKHFLGF